MHRSRLLGFLNGCDSVYIQEQPLNLTFKITIIFLLSLGITTAVARADEVVKIQVDPTIVISHISPDFIGFGYETSAVAQPNFFTDKNAHMIQLYRTLTPHGLIRIGGNVSDHTMYDPAGMPAVQAQNAVTIINQQNLSDLAKFAQATGWKVMWGLNLGTGTKEQAAKEAMDVSAALGSQLHSFQIGNEVDFMPRNKKGYDVYHSAFLDYKSAIRAALPDAPFSGPDCGGNADWVANFAATESRDIKLLTLHYYVGGAKDPSTSIEKMLKHDDRWEARLKKLQPVCKTAGVALRINEVNSFSGGGKPGVSDTFAEALWCLDYMFQLASCNCDGINVETDINHLAWISHYSPIVHDEAGNCTPRPEYYGMLAFATAGKGDLVKLTLDKPDINLTAYATKDDRRSTWITIINKDLSRDATVEIAAPAGSTTAEIYRLIAPSAQSKDQVTFAGAAVSADGTWAPSELEKIEITNHTASLPVARATAAVVRFK
jgi:hypothetical protein